jgi:uncharacterized protein (DUF1778 family)
MPTTNKRINITLQTDVDRALSRAARRDNVPEATKAAELLRIALEIEEDELLDNAAHIRDTKGATFVSHTEAWK